MAFSIAPPSDPSPKTSASPRTLSESLPSEAVRWPSPEPPPASPLTPPTRPARPATQAQAEHAPQSQRHARAEQEPKFIQQPPSLPFSGQDSSDAIALRAAISSLQFQRLQAQRDLRTLQDIKRQAVDHPEEYRRYVLAASQAKSAPPPWLTAESSVPNDDEDDDTMTGASESKTPNQTSKARKSSGFPAVPLPQAVVRCPPIEWEKYHITGEPLDKLHRDQQARPGHVNPAERESLVAAPYNPFLDKLESTLEAPAARKDSGSSASEQPSVQRRGSSKVII
jgi:hypothetical protein